MKSVSSPGNGNMLSIKLSLIGVMLLFSALFLIRTAVSIGNSHARLENSREILRLMDTGILLFQAVRNFGYERGRTNVVLNHAGPLEEMSANRAFILERRREGEQNLELAMTGLVSIDPHDKGQKIAGFEAIHQRVDGLRQKVDVEMTLPRDRRDPGLPRIWFSAMTEMIGQLQEILTVPCAGVARHDGPTATISYLMLTSISMRDECAPEMALLSGVMLSGKPITGDTYANILSRRGRSHQLLNNINFLSGILGDREVSAKVSEFEDLYNKAYLPKAKTVLAASLAGGPYPVSQKDFLATGVESLEALVRVMGAIGAAGKGRASQIHRQALNSFIFNLATLAAGIILMAGVMSLVAFRVINPLTSLARSTLSIANREVDFQVPYQDRKDEIGSVARAINVLQRNTERMIEDYELLQESKNEVEKALAEVRTLRGLLPICASCKKIRDDSGYWNQLEVYISHHTDAQFSHGICPDCMRELYPEMFQQVDEQASKPADAKDKGE